MTFRCGIPRVQVAPGRYPAHPVLKAGLDDLLIGYPLCSGQILIVGSFCQPNTSPHLAREVQRIPFQPCGCLRRITDSGSRSEIREEQFVSSIHVNSKTYAIAIPAITTDNRRKIEHEMK